MANANDDQPERLLILLQQLLDYQGTDVQGALNQAAHLVAQALFAEKADVFLYDEQKNTLVVLGVSQTSLGRLQQSLGLDRLPIANGGRTVQVFQTGVSYRNGHVDQDPEELPGIKNGMGVCSTIAVLLIVGSERRGILQVNSTQPEFFTEEDEHFLEGVAHWIGIVVHRAELLQHVAQKAARDARRLAAEELMSILAHDLRNYLTPIRARLGLLERRATHERRQQDLHDLTGIAKSLQRLERLIADLMDTSRLSQGLFSLTWHLVDLSSLVQDVATVLQTPSIQVVVLAPHDLQMWADPDRLRQALANLLANAIQHSSAGTSVQIDVETQEEGAMAVIAVSDQGAGIPEEMLPYLFEPFHKGPNSTGLGMGLYLASQIAQAHGGTLTVDPTASQGTRFVLRLPTKR